MSTTIVRLEAQNVMRLRAVRIDADGKPVIVVGGKNGNGKSSVLRSIEMALGGKRAMPPKPIRDGERRAEVTVQLSNGMIVTRTIDAAGGTKLVVTDAEGGKVRSPQAVLDKMFRTLAIDPLAMSRMRPAEQAAILREIAGVDTTELDGRRQATFDQRTDVNREVKRLKAQLDAAPHHPDAPAEEVSMAELASELELASEQNRDVRSKQDNLEDARRELDEAEDEVARLETELQRARKRRTVAADDLARAQQAAAAAELVDITPIRERMRTAEATNAKVRDNAARQKLLEEHREAQRRADALSDELDVIDEARAAMLAAAKLPIQGLGFDGEGVTLDGVPLEQASQAQQLRLWTAVGFRQNPELKVLLVRSGSDLDEDSLRLLGELAAAEGGEVWLERVSTGQECSVVIEDGMVRAVAEADTDPPPSTDRAPALAAVEEKLDFV